MMGQEGKTASRLQIDIQANVFVCCEKWCGRDSDQSASLPPSPTRPLFPLIFFLPPPSAAKCAESTESNSLIQRLNGGALWRHADFPKAAPHHFILLYPWLRLSLLHVGCARRGVPSILGRIEGRGDRTGHSQTRGVICGILNNLTFSGE